MKADEDDAKLGSMATQYKGKSVQIDEKNNSSCCSHQSSSSSDDEKKDDMLDLVIINKN